MLPPRLSEGDKALRRIVRHAYDLGRRSASDEDDEHSQELQEYLNSAPQHQEIAQGLKSVGLTDKQILRVCKVLSEADAQAIDDNFPGEPLTGGGRVPLREPHGMDARTLAMDAVRRVEVEPNYAPPSTVAWDSALDDERAVADFERRFGLPPLKFA